MKIYKIANNNEKFKFGFDYFDIDLANKIIETEQVQTQYFDPQTTKQLKLPFIYVDKNYAETTDIDKPIILATTNIGSFVIDGHHRVHKTIQLEKGINAYVLNEEQTKKIMNI
jgi:hypothetical protein